MNSVEGVRGFITFLILSGILFTGVIGFNFISQPVNTTSQADENKTEPLNVIVNEITPTSAVISWTTIEPSTSTIIYSSSLNADCLEDPTIPGACVSISVSTNQTSHSKHVAGLNPDTTYFFRILSNEIVYPKDTNHTFRTEPQPSAPSAVEDDFDGFGEVDIGSPEVIQLNNNVLGVQTENAEGEIGEPIDPLGDIDKMMQEQFNEAFKFNDIRFDFNKDGKVTMADYPLFIDYVLSE